MVSWGETQSAMTEEDHNNNKEDQSSPRDLDLFFGINDHLPHEEQWGVPESLSIYLPPGPLSVAIQRRSSLDDYPHRCRLRDDNIIGGLTGQCCVVSSSRIRLRPWRLTALYCS